MRLPRLPAPWHLAVGLLSARGSSLAEKVGAVRFLRFLQDTDYRLGDDCTVSALLDGHGQRGSLRRRLWEPLCLAALNTAPAMASAQIFVNTLRDSLGGGRAATDLLLPAADLDRLFPEAAAHFIRARGGEIRLSTRVAAIDDGFTVCGEHYDHAVVAVGPQHAPALLAGHAQTRGIAQLLAGYAFEPIATLYCGYPPQVCLPFPMLGLDDRPAGQDRAVGFRPWRALRYRGSHGLRAQRPWRLGNARQCRAGRRTAARTRRHSAHPATAGALVSGHSRTSRDVFLPPRSAPASRRNRAQRFMAGG
jgi:hypothetical protein